jgi:hypothetical protein
LKVARDIDCGYTGILITQLLVLRGAAVNLLNQSGCHLE